MVLVRFMTFSLYLIDSVQISFVGLHQHYCPSQFQFVKISFFFKLAGRTQMKDCIQNNLLNINLITCFCVMSVSKRFEPTASEINPRSLTFRRLLKDLFTRSAKRFARLSFFSSSKILSAQQTISSLHQRNKNTLGVGNFFALHVSKIAASY